MIDEYLTIKNNNKFIYKEKGSKFIALTYKTLNTEEADLIIQMNKKEYYDATHNCFAYRIGLDSNNFRFNDDGEPSGSAGKPILNAIDQLKVTNLLVIVNRYFGGTKLGIPGLVKAYHDSAFECIKGSCIIKEIISKQLLLKFDHNQINTIIHYISKNNISIIEQNYDDHVSLKVSIRLSQVEKFKKDIFNFMNGKLIIEDLES